MDSEELAVNLEQDLTEIANLIWGYMDKKYISQMKKELGDYRRNCEANLCKEAQLLRALMPFMPQDNKILQSIVDLIIYNDMIEQSIMQHQEFQSFYRDENKEKEKMKKLLCKLIMFRLVVSIEKAST